jgi:hypothetical protein
MKIKQLIKLAIVALAFPGVALVRSTAHAQTCVPPPSGMVSWYPGDGNANDIQGGNNGTLQNGATFAPGKVGQAFSFDGVDDEVVVPHNANQNTGSQITIDAWVSRNTFGHGWSIVNKRSSSNIGGYTFETTHSPFAPDNGLQWVIMIGGTFRSLQTPANVLTIGTFQHVAATYDGAMMRIYVDGVEKANMAVSGAIDAVSDPLVIGRNVVNTFDDWNGLIDEVELFNRALSQAEIQAIFDAGSAGKCKPAADLLNISTRLNVQTGDNVLIGGFIITGTDPKKVIVRGIGPSLSLVGVTGVLADPPHELHEPDGTVVTNDNWKDTQEQEIIDTTIPPTNDLESAIVATLDPGAYTVILAGKNDGTGIGLVEAYDLDQAAASQLANISTRGFVETGDNVMVGGFILGGGGGGNSTIVVRGIGPSLTAGGVAGALQDPTLELHDSNGAIIASNDNWMDSPDKQTIIDDGLAPTNDLESALLATLAPGAYTAIVSGVISVIIPPAPVTINDVTGVALVEVYNLQ